MQLTQPKHEKQQKKAKTANKQGKENHQKRGHDKGSQQAAAVAVAGGAEDGLTALLQTAETACVLLLSVYC